MLGRYTSLNWGPWSPGRPKMDLGGHRFWNILQTPAQTFPFLIENTENVSSYFIGTLKPREKSTFGRSDITGSFKYTLISLQSMLSYG